MQTIREQIEGQKFVTITGMDNNGVSFDISVPTASIQQARLEQSLDTLQREISGLNESYEALVRAGERTHATEVWGILLEEGDGYRLLSDDFDTVEQARAALDNLSLEIEEQHGVIAALTVTEHCVIHRLSSWECSPWLRKLTHRINSRVEQYNQTDQLLQAIGQ